MLFAKWLLLRHERIVFAPSIAGKVTDRPIGFAFQITYCDINRGCTGICMNDIPILESVTSLEDELLELLANQAKRVLIPVFLVSAMIAAFAAPYVPQRAWIVWLVAVLAILIARATVIPMLTRMPNLPRRGRLQIIMALSLIHGFIQAYSLTFFSEMGILEQSMQTMLLAGLCMGAVATTAGHLPFFLAFLLPIIFPLIYLWTTSLGGSGLSQLDLSVGFALLLFSTVLVSLAHETYQQFRRSFELRQEQIELNRQLREANDAKTRFLATASHDLRQPMQALTASIESLRFQDLDDESKEIVNDLNVAKKDLSELLSALLNISRLDAGVEDLPISDFNLYRLLYAVWEEHRGSALDKELELTLECSERANARSNPVQFKRIVSNLVSNAIRYTNTGSVRISARKIAGNFIVEVADTGIGIDESEQSRIFEDFYQAIYPARSQQRGGLGLGLSIVRRLTGLLHIKLNLKSKLGEGSVFSVVVPAAGEIEEVIENGDSAGFNYAGLKVLIVDDEAPVASALKKMLEKINCQVATSDGTEGALQIVRDERPDVLLVDRRLKGQDDGLDLIGSVRQIYEDMPAILISGDTAPDRINEAANAGIPLLVKPAQLPEIKRLIAELCG